MILTEKQLRLIVRKSILEGFLSSDVEDISSITATIAGKDYVFPVSGKTNLGGKPIIVFSIPRKVTEKLKSKFSAMGIQKLPAKKLKVKSYGREF